MLSKFTSKNMQIVKHKHVIDDSQIGYDIASSENKITAVHRILVNLGLKLPSFFCGSYDLMQINNQL